MTAITTMSARSHAVIDQGASSTPKRHVHFAPDLLSGSHRKPHEFRKIHREEEPIICENKADDFSRWFYDFHYEHPDKENAEICKARFSAIAALGESLAMAVIKAVQYVFAKVFYPESADSHWELLNMHWRSAQFSWLAIQSPAAAAEKYQTELEATDPIL
jgi:hypothetical protein